ncbi:MAG: BrnT family toxin [candidate division KSB1 bacterium]|nr:BrnT family toxin [candidate division KSB1 bacterium]MDZ7304929.1 BrnT family toxin [candidate division KSB1 bacterium]MDZ7311647.1 BrnT family toxin [candidate division KSB1 bacterium]
MFIRQVIIPENVEEKLWHKHHVEDFEVHAVFESRPHFEFRERGELIEGEDLYAAWGRTDAGRHLIVFFIYKFTQDALILSARDMTKSERTFYAKVKRKK